MDIPLVAQNIAFFAAFVAIFWLVGKTRQHRIAKQTELQQQVLAKFESAGELQDFLASESGRQFMQQFESKSHRGILVTLAFGIIFTFLGLGFLGLTALGDDDFLMQGVILLVFGLGFATAAAVSRRLSVQWEKESRNGY